MSWPRAAPTTTTAVGRLPDWTIVGAMKAGTTTVAAPFRRPATYPPVDAGLASELYDWFAEHDPGLAAC